MDRKKTNFEESLKSFNFTYRTNVSLRQITKRNRAGSCRFFFKPETEEELKHLICLLDSTNTKFLILGDCSNVYLLDNSLFEVIISTKGVKQIEITNDSVTCSCGYNLNKLSRYCVNNGISGYEGFLGIPGTVGGATVNNSGAYTSVMEKVVKSVSVYTPLKGIHTLSNSELEFSHRNSIFKTKKDTSIILSVTFDTSKKADLNELRTIADSIVLKRRTSIDSDKHSLGSIFISDSYKHFRKKHAIRLIVKKILYKFYSILHKNYKDKKRANKTLEFYFLGMSKFAPHCDTLNRFCWDKETPEAIFLEYLNLLYNLSENTLLIEIEIKGQANSIKKLIPFYQNNQS
ncbi:FAD-binding protein [uncultured Arcticibacterium sp.]|uniref:FAD-binding protein n=1 Tax=uncultured Arcticibacterium sp. TaxID=2173042 RepID=UPI0030F9BEC3